MHLRTSRLFLLACVTLGGAALAIAALVLVGKYSLTAYAAPIPPPEGYPKLSQSQMSVSPELVSTSGEALTFTIEVINTGAYTATNVSLTDAIPTNTSFDNYAYSSVSPQPLVTNGILTWNGTVGFDTKAVIQFRVKVTGGYKGLVTNQATIQHASLTNPVVLTAEAVATDDPYFEISKTSSPAVPGPNKTLTYTLTITNRGQDASNLPVTVKDRLPADTSNPVPGPDGSYNNGTKTVTWNRPVTLATGEAEQFWFSAKIGNVISGTELINDQYNVSDGTTVVNGDPYTVTVIKPVLLIYKETDPFPPGSNREMTYTLTVLNKGSLATDLTITDEIPSGVTYVRGGDSHTSSTVSWNLPSLDTGESAQVSFTVFVGDVAEVPVLNNQYQVSSAEGAIQSGIPLTSVVKGPSFVATAALDPLAKKPGGGALMTPTLTLANLGPGNALDATALMYFRRLSVSSKDFKLIPSDSGVVSVGPDCGDKCKSFRWVGDIAAGDMVTFTTDGGQSTIGGSEGTHITATIVVSDLLSGFAYQPITATAYATVTHFANLLPHKSAPTVIGAGQVMTYSFSVFNSGLSTDTPPFPVLTDSVPPSVTVVNVSDDGTALDIGGQTVVSWTLPSMGPADLLYRSYSVLVDPGLVSGTQIVNDDYRTIWKDIGATISQTYILSNTGKPVTTTVREVGLVDSSKTVTPTWSLPGPSNVLTYVVHIANTSPVPLSGVKVHDQLPWQVSTYQRDAIAAAGTLISDIVSLDWSGGVGPLSEQLVTFTVLVDPGYEGPVTNTAVITHSSLSTPVQVQAVAYITDDPVLRISKSASPDPVPYGEELLYTIHIANLGQQATELEVFDTLPVNTLFVPYSASGNGQLVNNQVLWSFPVLLPGKSQDLSFRVTVHAFPEVVNANYYVTSDEGATAIGEPLITKVKQFVQYLVAIFR